MKNEKLEKIILVETNYLKTDALQIHVYVLSIFKK